MSPGSEEGAFAWLTLNYLLGNLGKDPSQTVAAIDLGGGSVQQAFALPPDVAHAAPSSDYIMALSGGGKTYDVYVHSYLGFGLMAGRAAILQLETARDAHPCVPKDHSGTRAFACVALCIAFVVSPGAFCGITWCFFLYRLPLTLATTGQYEYAGTKHPVKGHPEGSSFERCADAVAQALQKEKDCGAPKEHCSFNGVWSGQVKPEVLYVSSYFWDRANDALMVTDETAVTATLTVAQFGSAAREACSTALPDVGTRFPRVCCGVWACVGGCGVACVCSWAFV